MFRLIPNGLRSKRVSVFLISYFWNYQESEGRETKKFGFGTIFLFHFQVFETFGNLGIYFSINLRILTGKKHPKIKLQRLQKIRMWTFGSLVHQINSFSEVLKPEQIFQKNKVVTGKTPLFVIGPFCSRHSICLNIGFWQSSFE